MRVLVIADSLSRSRRVAEMLSEDDRLDVLSALTIAQAAEDQALFADVIVAAGVSDDQMPASSQPVVALLTDSDAVSWSGNVRALLPLNTPAQEIVAAVIAAANRFTVLTSAQAQRWLPSIDTSEVEAGIQSEALTAREQQVLRMAADGLGNKEIAVRLQIAERTAKFHMGQILAKLGAASRTEAVSIGIRRGIVPL